MYLGHVSPVRLTGSRQPTCSSCSSKAGENSTVPCPFASQYTPTSKWCAASCRNFTPSDRLTLSDRSYFQSCRNSSVSYDQISAMTRSPLPVGLPVGVHSTASPRVFWMYSVDAPLA